MTSQSGSGMTSRVGVEDGVIVAGPAALARPSGHQNVRKSFILTSVWQHRALYFRTLLKSEQTYATFKSLLHSQLHCVPKK